MKRISLILSFLLGGVFSMLNAQDQVFTPEDVVGMNSALYAKNIPQLKWRADSDLYSFAEGDFLLSSDPLKKTNDTLVSLSQLNKAMQDLGNDSLKRLPQMTWINPHKVYFWTKSKLITLQLPTLKAELITTLPENAAGIDVALNSLKVAYTIENNLYVADGEKHTQITQDEEGIINGQSVHRNEFGINKGIFWSPDEQKIAFYRMDQTMVSDYPLVDISERIAKLTAEKYPMAGMTSHQVTIGIYQLNAKSTLFLETGTPADQYLTAVTWNPESTIIYTAILNRDQNHFKLKAFSVENGKETATLFEEHDDKYVEPSNPLHFVPGKPDHFIWTSDRDGFDHLYLYKTDGTMVKKLTQGEWAVTDFLGFNNDGSVAYYSATKESPLEQNTYGINLKSAKITRLTPVKGTHRSQISASGKYLIDSYSNSQAAREILVASNKGITLKTLISAANPVENFKMGTTKMLQLQANDGSLLYARMILPFDFDPSKKYPVVVYVYGGPHAQLITESWLSGANFYLHYLTQKGYVVFTLDNRGSDNRGKKFEQAIHRQVGKVEVEDQMTGIAYLQTLPFIDTNRIGVDGWSYGGFMSINLKLTHPEIFKVATAGGPVIDWKYYEIMYGERYMDHPDDNVEGYKQSCLLEKVPQLEGKLLVIHGTSDPVVVWQHSLQFIKKCVDEGKLVDYFVYPGHEHNVRGRDRAHLIRKITTYFDENL
ncbi:MAG: DPP IV N-terminal domain-containing protein [Bacteroidales bacterium]|nr:DPP IV N-terminal domain-containing protein [Bacteroidales bacterium]